ncbi:MAG: tyrosine-type recombinase/integrase [Thermodesulfobacteriota bacterium]
MGVFYKKNRWYLDYSLPDGKRKREVVSIEGKRPEDITRNDALKCLAIRQGQVAEGKFKLIETSRTMIFDKLAAVFLESYSKVNKRSWKRDRTSCRALMEHFSGMRLTQITPWHVDTYKAKRLKVVSRLNRPISRASINRELACLKKMLSYAVGENWLTSNPLGGYKLYKEVPSRTRVITPEEFQRVYNAASEFLRPILITAYNTGMRYSEILNLKWENVDLNENMLVVTESKNDESRYVPINEELKEALIPLKELSQCEYVFSHGTRKAKDFTMAFNNAVARSGVTRFTFHELRHTAGSNLGMEGVDAFTIGELLGQKTLAMTKRYVHPTHEHKKKAIQKISSGVLDTYPDTSVLDLRSKTEENAM